jgi:branched-chain amino acid transport system substrate-binding protein
LKRLIRLIAATAAFVVLTAGCSSSGKSASNDPGRSGSAGGTQPSGSTIAIGNIGTYSGPTAQSSLDGKDIIQAWAASVNAAGGINGHRVKVYAEDNGGNPATGLSAAKRLVEQEHVVAIVGMTDNNPKWADYVKSKGIPVVGGFPTDLQFVTDSNFFSVGGNIIANFYGIVAEAKKYGPKFASLYCAESASCASVAKLVKALGAPQGVTLPYAASVAASAPDFTAQCEAIKNSGASSYNLSVASALIARIAAQCQQLGFKAPIIEAGTSAGTNLVSQSAFDGAEFVDNMLGFFVDSTPATQQFHAALAKYAPSVGSSSEPLNSNGMAAWVSGKLFEAAIKATGVSGDITSDSVLSGLYALKGETLGGMTPPLTYTKGKPTLLNCYFTEKLQGGKFELVNGLTPTCADDAGSALIAGIASSLTKQ